MVYCITQSRLNLNVEDTFRAWLAGIIDGEGNFCNKTIHPTKISPVIRISLQEKDKFVLELIQKTIGGNLNYVKSQKSWKPNWNSQWKWSITSILECKEFTEWILPFLVLKHEDAKSFLRSLQ